MPRSLAPSILLQLLLAAAPWPDAALAQDRGDGRGLATAGASDPRDQAAELYERASTAYRDGRFAESARLLESAYELYPSASFLYNLARARENDGDEADALEAYERYLEEAEEPPNRGQVQARIAQLRSDLAEQRRLERLRDETPPARTSEATEADSDAGAWPWILVGVGAAAVGTGGGLWLVAKGREGDAQDATSHAEAYGPAREAEDFLLASRITIGIGAGLAFVGLIWGLLDLSADEESATAEARGGVRLTPTGLHVTF